MSDEQNTGINDQGTPGAPGNPGKGNGGNIALGCVVGVMIGGSAFFTLLAYSLGNGDESAYIFMIFPLLLLGYALYAIFRQKKKGFAQGLLIAAGFCALLLGLCFMG